MASTKAQYAMLIGTMSNCNDVSKRTDNHLFVYELHALILATCLLQLKFYKVTIHRRLLFNLKKLQLTVLVLSSSL